MTARMDVTVLLLALIFISPPLIARSYPCRWFFMQNSLRSDDDLAHVSEQIKTAASVGLNGMVLSSSLDHLSKKDQPFLDRLHKVSDLCAESNVELIPQIFSAGYGGGVLAFNKDLAAALLVTDALYVVNGTKAAFTPDPAVTFLNGGFEQYTDNRASAYNFHDLPGQVSFIDTSIRHSGAASLRFENFQSFPYGHARVMQEISVTPNRLYRITCWVKTEGLQPAGALRLTVLTKDGRYIAPVDPDIPSTTDWRKVTIGFNSLRYDAVRIYAGAWGGTAGTFRIDDFTVEEIGMVNLLNRPGTPVTVRNERTGQTLILDCDYKQPVDPKRNFRFDHDGPDIDIIPASDVKDGDRLRVTFYHGIAINRGQVSVCMSEPEVYDIWRREAALVHKHLHPNRYLLSMDEIRTGGACLACKKRNMTLAQILGDCITRQHDILKSNNPGAEILIWSDMLDPQHNAHADYYLTDGDFTASWNYIPKDLTIVCWYHKIRAESLRHFDRLGHKTIAGAYYDSDNLDNPKDWLGALDDTPNAQGIMYTTWQNKYDLLPDFGRLLQSQSH
jgi:hypothetical protein